MGTMTNLARMKVEFSGWQGGPGCNVLHFSGGSLGGVFSPAEAQILIDEVRDVYTAMNGAFLAGMTIRVPDSIEVIDAASGELINVVQGTDGGHAWQGGAPNALAGPFTMALVAFGTDTFLRGRRLQGRSFLGPLPKQSVTDAGQLNSETQGWMNSAYDAVLNWAGPRLAVYHRPTPATTGPNAKPATEGAYGDVNTITVRSKLAVLRSRRD